MTEYRFSRLAPLVAAAALAACGGPSSVKPAAYSAEIRRTSFGIPHIRANDEAGLGYGIGYAYAEDNVCLLANEIVTVNGERAKHFGADGLTSDVPGLQQDNLNADFFFRLLNDDAAVDAAWQRQPPEVQALIRGYAAGYNRFLDKTGRDKLPEQCRNAPWVRRITERDVIRLVRRVAVLNSSVNFMAGMATAQPPGAAAAAVHGVATPLAPHRHTASNAIALGKDATADGRGMLLGQPHLPWGGFLRFYQLHLTIPGKLDVMGATLPGLPVVGIGYTKNFAWSHTTDTSAHFTLYALRLDPADPTRYMVDGQSRPMTKKTIAVEVRQADGTLQTQTRTLYQSQYGPLVVMPQFGLEWSNAVAYAIRDANADNHRVVEQWYAMNRAGTLDELQAVNQRIVGNPWNNTIAADKDGNTLYMNVSPVANLSAQRQEACVADAYRPLAASGLIVLDGATAACAWENDANAPQPGIVAGNRLPVLRRGDYVQNANDSAWLANPAAPLAGFAPAISASGVEQGGRTRSGLQQLGSLLAGGGRISFAQLQDIALNNKVYSAQLIADDLLRLCGGARHATADDGSSVDLGEACAQLAAWDRSANADANLGYAYFAGVMARLPADGSAWAVPFDPARPLDTPRGLKVDDPAVAALLRQALASTVRAVQDKGWPRGARWGDILAAVQDGRKVALHGGPDGLGIYNAIESVDAEGGLRTPVAGTSYLQAVRFDDNGPHAQTLLTYSQSADPQSPHHADQLERFARKEWIAQPFTDAQIAADPGYSAMSISE